MDKTKTSGKRKKSTQKPLKLKIRDDVGVITHDPLKELLNEELIDAAIIECLKNNDPAGAVEVLQTYMKALSKSKKTMFLEADLPKTTAYHSMRSKNPTLKTFSKLMHVTHQRPKEL